MPEISLRAIAVRMAISGNIYQEISLILGVSIFLLVIGKKIKPKASPELN
jgi:hypothetical protein